MKSVIADPNVQWEVQKYILYLRFRGALYVCTEVVVSKGRLRSYLGFCQKGVKKRQNYRHLPKTSKTSEDQ